MQALRQARESLTAVRQRFGRRIRPLSDPEQEAPAPDEELTPTPIYIGQRTRIVLMAAMVIGLVLLVREAPSIPRLLLLGATVALVMSFPVRVLSAFLPRKLAILIVVSSTIAFSTAALILLIPFMVSEISRFVTNLPDTADTMRNLLRDVLDGFYRRGWIRQRPDTIIEEFQANLFDRGEMIAQTLLTNVVDTLTRTFSLLITTFGILFIATYLLIDIPRFRQTFVHAFSPAYRDDATQLWSTIGDSLSRYLAGLFISLLIQGTLAAIGLALIGVPYALVLGLWMSVTAILPYIGAFLGAIPAVLIALTVSWETAAVVALLYVAINQIEGNLITPRIQGGAIRVHPLLIFVSVIGGTEIAGPLGAILAVPTLAVVRVLVEFLWDRLQIRQPRETVLVALGGTDDEDEAEATVQEGAGGKGKIDVRVRQEVRSLAPAVPAVQDSTEVTVRVAANRRTPITHPRRRRRIRRRKVPA
jgi:predicted PurR-regulated permease PerM